MTEETRTNTPRTSQTLRAFVVDFIADLRRLGGVRVKGEVIASDLEAGLRLPDAELDAEEVTKLKAALSSCRRLASAMRRRPEKMPADEAFAHIERIAGAVVPPSILRSERDRAIETTERGFGIYKFTDRGGHACSLQKSSSAEEPCIWLGLDVANNQVEGWHPKWTARMRPLEVSDLKDGLTLHAFARMHLTQDAVRELLPMLAVFVETGDIVTESPSCPITTAPKDGAPSEYETLVAESRDWPAWDDRWGDHAIEIIASANAEFEAKGARIRELEEREQVLAKRLDDRSEATARSIIAALNADQLPTGNSDVEEAIKRRIRSLTERRPMSTAPRDGTEVVLDAVDGGRFVCAWEGRGWQSESHVDGPDDAFRGWYPLPTEAE